MVIMLRWHDGRAGLPRGRRGCRGGRAGMGAAAAGAGPAARKRRPPTGPGGATPRSVVRPWSGVASREDGRAWAVTYCRCDQALRAGDAGPASAVAPAFGQGAAAAVLSG